MTTGEKIKALRLEKGMTQEELGDKLGVKKAAVHKWETGLVVNIKRSTLAKLCAVLDTTPDYLMGYKQQEEPQADPLAEQFTDMFMRLSAEQRLEIVSTMLRMIG